MTNDKNKTFLLKIAPLSIVHSLMHYPPPQITKTYVLTSGVYPAMRDSLEFSGGSEILSANPIHQC